MTAQRIAAVLAAAVIADAVDAQPRTVRSWLAETSTPTGRRARRFAAPGALTDQLMDIIDTGYIREWMATPITALDDQTPAETIASGEVRRVLQIVSTLKTPGAA